jgi:membrane-associated phospholipid phosphatase
MTMRRGFLAVVACLALAQVDKPISDYVHWHTQKWDGVLQVLTLIGDGGALALISVACGLLWRDRRVFTDCIGAFLLSAAAAFALKSLIGRPRPYLQWDSRYHVTSYSLFQGVSLNADYGSFPSGHAAGVFTVAWVIIKYGKGWSRAVKAALLAFCTVVALTRMALAKHFLADVAAGAVLGIACAEAVFYARLKARTRMS